MSKKFTKTILSSAVAGLLLVSGGAMAEDIKMNVFPQVTSAEYIYGELVDGSQIKIKKSDLACLIGAVIYSSSITDLDKIETQVLLLLLIQQSSNKK